MINILIVDDNISYATNLMNYINSQNENVRVCNIALDGEKAVTLLNSNTKIDIVLLDLKMPIYNGSEVLNLIVNKEKYIESFIIISGETNFIKNLQQTEMVYSIINKTTSMNYICKKVNELIKYKTITEKKINDKKLIENELIYLGYDISHKGTTYLIEVINYIKGNPHKFLDNLSRDVYPVISKHFNESSHNIKCRINHETKEMYLSCEMQKLKNYFHYSTDAKPNVKTVVNTVINKLS